ncbi:cAMP phosphodiesterase class-II [Colletotrichum graminicola]|uniref:cAMP phosphodiesterase class-II n=1 Tax=Colletotrichum graminicola (strain M1.001 / M2 / FGSC 10212) TaxID=645133 RepID=E3Q7W6_COLGM|nr:cAMP phosphodiesterase class-II [Colletotrichum graminicola M1.001]EFQ26978.1 cAMP phosphodiesterase class-II [Colletotrichum graminicola M1.001]WDK16692.1 cAMP phosphodiesterase class-II [Colletotrichum graminicola]
MEDKDGKSDKAHCPALQVIILGAGGGPQENNTTALLVRSVASGWTKGSIIAVDAGVHLSAITHILETSVPPGLGSTVPLPHTLTSGPFAGLELRSDTTSIYPSSIAAHITRSLIDTYLITHPHLDHISGFVVNTAGLTRPKRLAALPNTINAFKTHIFNNVIWPNLSDENNGAGIVTYTRLVEGGSPSLGDGEFKGYLEIADRLAVKAWSVSHGHCLEKHPHRGSTSSAATPMRYSSVDAASVASPRIMPHGAIPSAASIPRASSVAPEPQASICVYDSSAYFILDMATNLEILVFGDVEPDSLSLSPRNLGIWQEAAPKIASGNLAAIFIECSYDDSHSVDRLFGHLKPCFVMEEMRTLAQEVEVARQVNHLSRKRKRAIDPEGIPRRRTGGAFSRLAGGDESPVSPKTVAKRQLLSDIGHVPPLPPAATSMESPHLTTPTKELSLREAEGLSESEEGTHRNLPLKGIKVVIIHVKDRLDGRNQGDVILQELRAYEEDAQLGCEFVISEPGQSIYL